jgi:hypothetical protein
MTRVYLWFTSFFAAFLFLTTACIKPCDPANNALVGDEFFTVTYLDNSGTNYLDIYNLDRVVVFLDTTGGSDATPRFELINPGYEDGKFGPFAFTDKFSILQTNDINLPLLFGQPFKYDYYIKKDTYGPTSTTPATANACRNMTIRPR